MPFLAGIIVAVLAWAMWTKKIGIQQLPPVLLGLAGAFIALKGQFLVGALLVGGSIFWFRGMAGRLSRINTLPSNQAMVDKARFLLGANAHDDAEMIRKRYRRLMAENHPDKGGNAARAQQLNDARDLLLAELRKSR